MKPNSWDPLLEIEKLKEELKKKKQFVVFWDSPSQVWGQDIHLGKILWTSYASGPLQMKVSPSWVY